MENYNLACAVTTYLWSRANIFGPKLTPELRTLPLVHMNSMANRSAVTPPATHTTLTSMAAYLPVSTPAYREIENHSWHSPHGLRQHSSIFGYCAHHQRLKVATMRWWCEWSSSIREPGTREKWASRTTTIKQSLSSQAMPRGEWDDPGSRAKPCTRPNPPSLMLHIENMITFTPNRCMHVSVHEV